MKLVRVGIVGAGRNTKGRHLPGLQAIEGVEIVSVCNRSRESSERAAAEFGIPKVYGDWRELVAAPDTEALVIGTWPYLHCPVTLAALDAGKHVLCEARMAMNLEEARRMLDAARRRPRLVAQVVPSPMTLHADATVQEWIAEGNMGKILAVEVRDASGFLDRESALQWRQDATLSGLNVMSMGIWYEAVLRWVGEAARVMAKGKVFVTMRKDAEDVMRSVRIPEHLDVVAELARGAQMHMQISRALGLSDPPSAVLYGSEGTLKFTGGRLYGGRRGESALREVPTPTERDGWRVEEEFVRSIRDGEPVRRTSFEDGVRYMAFTQAVAESMATGQERAVAWG
jgi:predicted dehydrogenase